MEKYQASLEAGLEVLRQEAGGRKEEGGKKGGGSGVWGL